MKFSDLFYQRAGARWRLAKALAMVETGDGTEDVDPFATGDSEDARGAWQLHGAFAQQFAPRPSGVPTEVWMLLRGTPDVSVVLVGRFLSAGIIGGMDGHPLVEVGKLADLDAALVFHYGHLPAVADGKRIDPDGYAAKVAAALESAIS
jgi:hypothetical protein